MQSTSLADESSLTQAAESEGAIPRGQVASLARRPLARVEGVAVCLTSRNDLFPHALLHNLKHNHVLHRHNYVTTVRTLQKPFCEPCERLRVERVDESFARLTLSYGFMESPQVRQDLIAAGSLAPGADWASFFIGRNSYAFSAQGGMPAWQDVLFLALPRNAADPTDYFNIPSNRVIELGAQDAI